MNRFFLLIILFTGVGLPAYSQKDSIDLFIQTKMVDLGIPGAQISILKNGKIIKSGHYGIANVEDSIRVDANTVFALNSITKAFTGVAIMQLVEQNKISLNDPISMYIDSLPIDWQSTTLTQLLTHTSGLPDMMDYNGKIIATWEEVQQLPRHNQPGMEFRYNQLNYVLLGIVINKISGMPFQDFIRTYQLTPINAKRTIEAGFGHYESVIPHSARGYTYFKYGKLSHVYEEFPPEFRTAAGMGSTATEMANWINALLNGELLNESASLSILWTPAILKNGQTGGFNRMINGYAIGWPIIKRDDHPAAAAIGGGRSALFVYPDNRMAIVVLTNLQGAFPEKYIDDIAGFYIPEMKKSNGFGFSPSKKLLWKELKKNGYKKAVNDYQKLLRENKTFLLQENEINNWGYELINQKKVSEAVELFKLNVFLFPDSYNTFDSLGEAFELMGDKKKAIKNYENSLKLNPDNKNALEWIKKLSIEHK